VAIERRRVAAVPRVPGAAPWWLVGLAALVLVLTTIDVANRGALTDFDDAVSRRMIDWDLRHNAVIRPVMHVLVLFGQRGVVLAITVPVICYLTWRSPVRARPDHADDRGVRDKDRGPAVRAAGDVDV
jgi:hypothetical protein